MNVWSAHERSRCDLARHAIMARLCCHGRRVLHSYVELVSVLRRLAGTVFTPMSVHSPNSGSRSIEGAS